MNWRYYTTEIKEVRNLICVGDICIVQMATDNFRGRRMQTVQCEVYCCIFVLQYRSQFIKIIILFCAEAIEGKMSHV